ncbi:MAG: histidine phosphatase family protein [Pseudobdellovibrionaceae bacterium]|nr:histidine phosphatase family protein [Pseudobdellovibrionaceae bacterium]
MSPNPAKEVAFSLQSALENRGNIPYFSAMRSPTVLPLRPFYLLRHGESEYNARNIAAGGGVDTPLTDIGRAQARGLADVIGQLGIKPSRIYHSHQSRARETAEIVNRVFGLDILQSPNLQEHMFGTWEGIKWDDLQSRFAEGQEPENGETRAEFFERAGRGIRHVLETSPEDYPLIAAHGGVFRALGGLYGVEIRHIGNCELRLFEPLSDVAYFPWKMTQFKPSECGQKLVSSEIFPK